MSSNSPPIGNRAIDGCATVATYTSLIRVLIIFFPIGLITSFSQIGLTFSISFDFQVILNKIIAKKC